MRAMIYVVLLLTVAAWPAQAKDLAIVGARIYAAPDREPIDNGTILIHDGRIVAVGPGPSIAVAPGTQTIDAHGAVVTAGFWNSHVHIMMDDMLDAEHASTQTLNRAFEAMANRWGVTTMFELAGDLQISKTLRRRIDAGEVRGPLLLTVGLMVCPVGGTPIYIREWVARHHYASCEVSSPEEAARRVADQLDHGADGVKLMLGAYMGPQAKVVNLRSDIAKAVVAEAHKRGKPVFAHPHNFVGIETAIESGVDIFAHATVDDGDWTPDMVQRMRAHHMALIPTLELFEDELTKSHAPEPLKAMLVQRAVTEVKAFSDAGGPILFGTDGGLERCDPTKDYLLMARVLSWRAILASLTTGPAERFGYAARKGRIAPGMDADLVVLDADPATDPGAFGRVRETIRGGRVIFEYTARDRSPLPC